MSATPGSNLPSPDDGRTPLEYKAHFKARKDVVTRFVDPCEQASKASMECLNKNDYDRTKCKDFFEAYKDCKKSWLEKRRQDGLSGKNNKIDV